MHGTMNIKFMNIKYFEVKHGVLANSEAEATCKEH
jgi:hypothetical protein